MFLPSGMLLRSDEPPHWFQSVFLTPTTGAGFDDLPPSVACGGMKPASVSRRRGALPRRRRFASDRPIGDGDLASRLRLPASRSGFGDRSAFAGSAGFGSHAAASTSIDLDFTDARLRFGGVGVVTGVDLATSTASARRSCGELRPSRRPACRRSAGHSRRGGRLRRRSAFRRRRRTGRPTSARDAARAVRHFDDRRGGGIRGDRDGRASARCRDFGFSSASRQGDEARRGDDEINGRKNESYEDPDWVA